MHKGDPFFPFVQMQDPSTLLHNPSLQSAEQFCLQASPYVPWSQAIKHITLHLIFSLFLIWFVVTCKLLCKYFYTIAFSTYFHEIFCIHFVIKYNWLRINNVLLLLQKTSRYPKAHPLSQCPLVELQGRLCKQFPLHCVIQSLPYIPFVQPVVRNEKFISRCQCSKNDI